MAVGSETLTALKALRVEGHQPPRLLVLFDPGQEWIARLVADVLGYTCRFVDEEGAMGSLGEVAVIGIEVCKVRDVKGLDRAVLATHCIDEEGETDEKLIQACDYEFLYSQDDPATTRKDLVRFLAFVLGQVRPHDEISRKQRSTMLSLPLPDVRCALPDLDIVSIGADAIELRVDLLWDTIGDGQYDFIPSLKLAGEQVMLLRQRTELPIVFAIRSTAGNGRFPTDNPELCYSYLRRAIQWGCEYIDVELSMPVEIRRKMAAEKGNTKIISSWHDLSGAFKWSSPVAERLFRACAVYGDVVKMVAVTKTQTDDHELESFRSMMQRDYPQALFCGVNVGAVGQLSRTMNRVLTPITHPLLKGHAAPGEMSAAQINSTLHATSNLPALDIYVLSDETHHTANFYTQCLNELSLPYTPHTTSPASLSASLGRPKFGGCTITPSLSVKQTPCLPTLSAAASAIGKVDAITVQSTSGAQALLADNLSHRAIIGTLTSAFLSSAYTSRYAIVLANNESPAAEALYALGSLGVATIYTIGFEATSGIENVMTKRIGGLEELSCSKEPVVVISALPGRQAKCIAPVLTVLAEVGVKGTTRDERARGVFLDLKGKGMSEAAESAEHLGWKTFDAGHVQCRFVAETLRQVCGVRVPIEVVQRMGGCVFA
ncbi:pentafunctional arom polypeptide like protein [Zymoseptoria brevis]|uniref:Pentafunctional arom polypeptide like protein n=1 Tax=Zymoseptoria brevis TaxID=1047168 RepID=A0A0F4GAT3_9PEZI|nr:pentafunctional arom polypeptide like protein [Zymoseptoria brevis]